MGIFGLAEGAFHLSKSLSWRRRIESGQKCFLRTGARGGESRNRLYVMEDVGIQTFVLK